MFKDHRGAVRAVALSGNGKLASAGDDRSVLVRDPGSAPVALTGHQAPVHALAFHPSAPVVVSGSADGQIIEWDLASRTPVQQMSLPHGRINGLELSSDGRWLAAVTQDGTALLWERADAGWRDPVKIPHDLGALNGVTLSGDLVGLAGENGALVYDRNAKTGRTYRDHDGAVRTIALSQDGTAVATGGADGQVVLRVGDEAPKFLRRHIASLRSVRFTPGGGELMSASDDGSIRWWSVPGGGWLTGLIGRTGAFFAAALSPDGTRIAAGGDDSVSLWQVALPPFTGHAAPPFAVAVAEDGTVATGGADRTIMVWGADGVRRHVLTAPATVKSLLFHPDGTLLSAGEDGATTVWDIAAHKPLRTFTGHQGPITGLSLNSSGDLAASGGADRTIRLFDPRTNAPARVLPAAHTAEVEALQFSPDGRLLASGGADGRLVLWDVEHDRRLAVLSERDTALRDIAFTPDGATLITGDADGVITLWDVGARREVGTLPGQRGAVREIAVSGNLLAVAGSDMTITVWDIASRAQIAALTGHSGPANALAFGGGDGLWLASTGADPRVILWHIAPDSVVARICEQHGRCP
jgi:WD40 repeat protein